MTPRTPKLKVVAYLRVSRDKQGLNGLGMSAQRQAIETYVKQHNATVVGTFEEVESGKHNDRPHLKEALTLAKQTGATLVIAKLDRLSRNAAFLLTLKDSGAKFEACDLPGATDMTIGILAVVAQAEREMISKRTSEALQAAKRRGVKLGNPNGARDLLKAGKGNVAGLKAIADKANAHAERLQPVIAALRKEGVTSLGSIAAELNQREMLTPRGGRWHKSSVRNLLARLNRL
jgi:DNA invertase Pin-like site-specific DNA recombinase